MNGLSKEMKRAMRWLAEAMRDMDGWFFNVWLMVSAAFVVGFIWWAVTHA